MAASGKNVVQNTLQGAAQPSISDCLYGATNRLEFQSVETGELMFGESEEELLQVALLSSVDFLYSGLSSCVP